MCLDETGSDPTDVDGGKTIAHIINMLSRAFASTRVASCRLMATGKDIRFGVRVLHVLSDFMPALLVS